jgi:hypothetical protein
VNEALEDNGDLIQKSKIAEISLAGNALLCVPSNSMEAPAPCKFEPESKSEQKLTIRRQLERENPCNMTYVPAVRL